MSDRVAQPPPRHRERADAARVAVTLAVHVTSIAGREARTEENKSLAIAT